MKIKVEGLSHRYAGAAANAVKDVSFDIAPGQIFGFLGPSGAGKSTVQNIMTALLPLQKGTLLYDGKTLSQWGRSFFEHIGVSFEHPNLYEKLTATENLHYYAALFPGREVISPAKLLDMVGLGDSKNKRAAQFSKGMKQRLVFARAIQHRPEILFLDEPTSGLDPNTTQKIKEIILAEKQRGATIFLTTHNMHLAEELCDVVAFINEGEIVAQDSPRNLKLSYGEKALKVEFRDDGETRTEVLFLEKGEDQLRLNDLMAAGTLETLHSQEASLEQIFIKLTGRGLA